MENNLSYKIINRLREKFLNSVFLKRVVFSNVSDEEFEVSEKLIRDYFGGEKLEKAAKAMVSNCNFSAKNTLEEFKEIIELVSRGKRPEDWLEYIYHFTLQKSFPNSVEIELSREFESPCALYLEILKSVDDVQKESEDGTWQSKYSIHFLSEEEVESLEDYGEYERFREAFEREYVYELMKLNQEITRYNNLDHICGVHFVSLFIGRQFKSAGIPVDLGRVSGSGLGHDIGKYGCKKSELARVPYLHYYYTDQWFKKHEITYIGNVALNHSVWDIELENLSLESLILIYSDFRVKNDGDGQMKIYSLKDSFNVILAKLDDVDDAKRKRYIRVYNKIKDFENYMMDIGINVDTVLRETGYSKPAKKYYALMSKGEIVDNFKYLAVNHNINLMFRLKNELSLNQIIEMARSERDSNNLRKYLEIFEEYSTYLTQRQKYITTRFLYEKLIHNEDDIRRRCSEIIGKLIANFDEEYRKEVPEDVELEEPEMTSFQVLERFMEMFVYPDHNIMRMHQLWIGEALSIMIESLFRHSSAQSKQGYVRVMSRYYKDMNSYADAGVRLYLLKSLKHIPFEIESKKRSAFVDYIKEALQNEDERIRNLSYEVALEIFLRIGEDSWCTEEIVQALEERKKSIENKYELWTVSKVENELSRKVESPEKEEISQVELSELFLNNFKNTTSWVLKRRNIEILLSNSLVNMSSYGLYTAIHFCNLLKVSPSESTRLKSGEALIRMFPSLPPEQGNDVAIELFRSLEIEEYQFTKYIPNYLGQILLHLSPENMDVIVEDLRDKMKKSGAKVNSLLLRTIGICIANYSKYRMDSNDNDEYQKRLVDMLGILLSGLAHNDNQVKQMAFSVIGSEIFGCKDVDQEYKNHIFSLIAKKILTLIGAEKQEELTFLNNSAVLNNIYRFISDYTFFNGEIEIKSPGKAAFFPGAFDPFSSGHREITREIRKKGFEVYLAVDEFSWSKSTQPNSIRRNIINMSIADELNMYVYPEDFPVNIANPDDLKVLRQNFKDLDVYIVVGSDVVLNASAYRKELREHSIQTFPHVVFERRSMFESEDTSKVLENALENIKAHTIRLNLPPRYEDVSSTMIRSYIDENRDISKLVDPMVQRYIYENGLYRKEPSNKSLIQKLLFEIDIISDIRDSLIEKLALDFHYENYTSALKALQRFSENPLARILIVKDSERNNKIIGYSLFNWLESSQIYNEFMDSKVSECIRESYLGRIILINGIFIDRGSKIDNLNQIILTETLAYCISRDYGYCVYTNKIDQERDEELYETLELQGFKRLECSSDKDSVFAVNMNRPCSLYLDIASIIKAPFRDRPAVVDQIKKSRKRLQRALSNLYPGELVLSIDRRVLDEKLMKKICRENGVPTTQLKPRKLGESMCVPFGNILNRLIIPNTVTKALHTEKIFERDMSSFRIEQSAHYLDLENQIKMIKSFGKPVILIDDILNKGYRIRALDPLLKGEEVDVQKIVVGMLSGRGKELMDIQGRQVDSAYFVPNLRLWFTEQLLYPFMGGDALWREYSPRSNIIPSLNMVLPYAYPKFIRGACEKSIYELSRTCLENAFEILKVLETEYENINERNLTLGLLGEVFLYPRCPEMGKDIRYDLNINPSSYIESHLKHLKRLESGFK